MLKVFHMVRRALGEEIPVEERLPDEQLTGEESTGSSPAMASKTRHPSLTASGEEGLRVGMAGMSLVTPPQTPGRDWRRNVPAEQQHH